MRCRNANNKLVLKFKDYENSKNVDDLYWNVNYKWTSKVNGTLIAILQGQVYELCGCKDDVITDRKSVV